MHYIFTYVCLVITLGFTIAFLIITLRKKDKSCINEINDFGPVLSWFHIVFLVFFVFQLLIQFLDLYGTFIGKILGWFQLLICLTYLVLWVMAQVYFFEKDNDCRSGWKHMYNCVLAFIILGYVEVLLALLGIVLTVSDEGYVFKFGYGDVDE
eukprot:TRINITY_DN9038_c0_g1_i14.p1 TRINITY_DN9038_c0_g1~~TRINITY_DN9038_c0_g1_i14.p1  ORF type:complete len:153 (+),score=25.76 TRINITY_DN9038_c0_g1_i14:101-559(+)